MVDGGDEGAAVGRQRRRPPVALVALLVLVALPVVIAGLQVSRAGWTPALDDGVVVTRSYDVLSSRSPLLGQFSLAGDDGATPAHSLGPLLYWSVAIPARFLPTWMIPLWMAALSSTCLASVVALAHRRAGLAFAAGTTVGLLLAERALDPILFAAVWNPWAGLAPLALLALLAWSVADGDRWLLPVAVLVASFTMQAHLTYVLPSVALLVVAGAVPSLTAARDRWRPPPSPVGDDGPDGPDGLHRRGPWWAPLAAAVLVGLVCWAPPLLQQLRDDPGNLSQVAGASGSDRPTAGSEAAAAAIGRTLGVPPGFARSHTSTTETIREGIEAGPTVGLVTGLAVVAAVVAVGVLAWRARDRTTWVGALVAGALVGPMVVVAWIMPLDQVLVVAYAFRWFAVAGVVVWGVVGLGVGRSLQRIGRLRSIPTWAAGVLLAVVAVVAVLPLTSTGRGERWSYGPADRLGDALLADTEPGGTYLLANNGPYVVTFVPALAWRLREADRNPILQGDAADAFGDDYAASGRPCDGVVVLLADDAPVPAGGRALVTVAVDDAPSAIPTSATLVLLPDPEPSGSC